tara:strand:+ start:10 stop:1239 length:1230 start_codon:yes stop_codon:yes gene_type:complete
MLSKKEFEKISEGDIDLINLALADLFPSDDFTALCTLILSKNRPFSRQLIHTKEFIANITTDWIEKGKVRYQKQVSKMLEFCNRDTNLTGTRRPYEPGKIYLEIGGGDIYGINKNTHLELVVVLAADEYDEDRVQLAGIRINSNYSPINMVNIYEDEWCDNAAEWEHTFELTWSNYQLLRDYLVGLHILPSLNYPGGLFRTSLKQERDTGKYGAESYDGWVKSTASESFGYPSFLRKKQFHFEKQFRMLPHPNILKIDVDGYFTGISYEDEDESYFNTPELIDERKEFVGIYTDERLHKILEKYTMDKIKNYYEEIAHDMSAWRDDEEDEWISYCDDYFKEQMNTYMSEWLNSWMAEYNIDLMTIIHPTFLPTHIKFVDETRGITLYEHNMPVSIGQMVFSLNYPGGLL